MSLKRGVSKCKIVAKLVTEEKGPCSFCQRDVDDELIYGKLYAIGSIKCHYFCVLLSCCMVQKGRDEDGLFGFLYHDILAEIERSKKHKCSYCNKEGANLGCCISQCRKQFHLPCGREKNAVSLFYGSYKSFCQTHTPKQKIADDVMAKAKVRMQAHRRRLKMIKDGLPVEDDSENAQVCVICYEEVSGFPDSQTFWPPCCARDAWFHRQCLQRMALSAGMHYLKCPLCNDKEHFYDAVVSQGYYVPDRDAAWELEQNAFADMYERTLRCLLDECLCPMGRDHDSESGLWDIKLCVVCGSSGGHAHCLSLIGQRRLLCDLCRSAQDVDKLADTVEAVMLKEQEALENAARADRRPLMPSRMSLRRTKQRINYKASTSQSTTTREENLKSPKRQQSSRQTDKIPFPSPMKNLEQLYEKIYDRDKEAAKQVMTVFRKPKPLSVKRNQAVNLLNSLVNKVAKENSKNKEPVKGWCSPKKNAENTMDTVKEEATNTNQPKQVVTSPYKSPPHTPVKTYESQNQKSPDNKANIKNEHVESQNPENAAKITNEHVEDPKITEHKDEETVINDDDIKQEKVVSDDESSNSTFQLPPEFIADNVEDDDSLPIFDTPKLKTVDIQKDSSLEISENDEVVKVDVIKMEENTPKKDFNKLLIKIPLTKCEFKFSPLDNETLEKKDAGFDLECFKNRYLNEVGRDFKCKFKHNHSDIAEVEKSTIKTAIDFALDATNERKRSAESNEVVPKKKQKRIKDVDEPKKTVKKHEEKRLKKSKAKTSTDIQLVNENKLKLSFKGKRKKEKAKVSIKDKEIKVRIQWKKKRLQVKITESNSNESKKLKQYVLKYHEDGKEPMLEKPKFDVTPIKKKKVKQGSSPDNLKQTSIQSFFKVKQD